MKNKIIIFAILFIPLAVFAYLQANAGNYHANEINNNENLISKIDTKGKLLKFSSPMCSECKEVAKTVSKIMPEYTDSVVLEEVNVSDGSEKSGAMIKMYKVSVVPTMIFIDKGGNVVHKTEGSISEEETREHLNQIK